MSKNSMWRILWKKIFFLRTKQGLTVELGTPTFFFLCKKLGAWAKKTFCRVGRFFINVYLRVRRPNKDTYARWVHSFSMAEDPFFLRSRGRIIWKIMLNLFPGFDCWDDFLLYDEIYITTNYSSLFYVFIWNMAATKSLVQKKITEHCMRPTLGTKLEHSTRLSVTAALLDE
jgi:hypothetical protein